MTETAVPSVQTREVAADEEGLRLEKWFRRHYPRLPRARLEKLLRSGQIRLDGKRVKAATTLAVGQQLRVPPIFEEARPIDRAERRRPDVSAEDRAMLQEALLYRDDWLLALDKPHGLAVQGGSRQQRHLDALLPALAKGGEAPRLVHRLDRDTSGVLLLAATREAARRLSAAFKSDRPRKIYWALVVGGPEKRRGEINLPLAKSGPAGGEKVTVDEARGKPAKTRYAVLGRAHGVTWLGLRPMTGRTHQLRVHCLAKGWPIVGDGKYAGRAAFPERPKLPGKLMLHARELALPHPSDETTFRAVAPPSEHMLEAFQALGFDPNDRKAAAAAAWLEETQ